MAAVDQFKAFCFLFKVSLRFGLRGGCKGAPGGRLQLKASSVRMQPAESNFVCRLFVFTAGTGAAERPRGSV